MAVNFVQCARCGNGVPIAATFCASCGTPRGGVMPPAMMPQMMPQQNVAMVPMVMPALQGFMCRGCGLCAPPMLVQKISVGGWVLFGVMVLVFFPLCWIGLLIKETRTRCMRCGIVT